MATWILRVLFFARKDHYMAVLLAVAVMLFLPQEFKDDQWTIVSLIAIFVLLKEAYIFCRGKYDKR